MAYYCLGTQGGSTIPHRVTLAINWFWWMVPLSVISCLFSLLDPWEGICQKLYPVQVYEDSHKVKLLEERLFPLQSYGNSQARNLHSERLLLVQLGETLDLLEGNPLTITTRSCKKKSHWDGEGVQNTLTNPLTGPRKHLEKNICLLWVFLVLGLLVWLVFTLGCQTVLF